MQVWRTSQNKSNAGRCPGANPGECPHALEHWQPVVICLFNDDYGSPAPGAFMAEERHHQVLQVIESGLKQFEPQLSEAHQEKRLGAASRHGNPDGVQIVVDRTIGRDTQYECIPAWP